MPLSRCKMFSRLNIQCGLTASHPDREHSFAPIPPGPPSPPPRRDYGERYVDEDDAAPPVADREEGE